LTAQAPVRGLTSAEAAERAARGETNAFKARVGRSYWDIVRDNLFNLFNIVIGTLLIVVLFFGDYATVVFAGFAVVTNSLLGMAQEIDAKRKLDRLAALAAATIKVYRDGALTRLPIEAIVKDDVIPIEPGDRLVVDGRVLVSDALEMDESQLTGESDAVLKDVGSPVYSGSFCIAGSGVMVATTVGAQSRLNRLSSVAKAYKRVFTPTQQRLNTIVQVAVLIMAICTPMIFVSGYLARRELFHLETFRNAVVFVTSLVPQGLVLTATLSLTIGALIISRFQTLVQRINAVESMANVTVLCFDKTGTLTKNQLSVRQIVPLNGLDEAAVRERLRLYLGNLSHLNRTAAAVAGFLRGETDEEGRLSAAVAKQREIPFTSQRKWGAVVLPDETLILGAPERVLPHTDGSASELARTLASQGLRVLALAHSASAPTDSALPEREALALIVLSDQIREDIQETLQAFREQGIALKVISGDNLETVIEIAQEAGLRVRHAYTGDQLEAMNADDFDRAAQNGEVFARIEPETKRRIIAALKRRGEYVAMVGDGVNDVPALKEAHLAIVMNDGAQISKDVGDLVLLNNAMSTLPRALAEGRIITQSIWATAKIFLVKNIYSTLLFIFAGFMTLPFPISPIQISWVTFGIVNIPAGLIALRVLKPAPLRAFRRDVLDYVVTVGIIGAAAMALLYAISFLTAPRPIAASSSRSTMMLLITFYGMLVLWHVNGLDIYKPAEIIKKWQLFLVGIGLSVLTILAPYLLPNLFEFTPPTSLEWLLTGAIFLLSIVLIGIAMRTRAIANALWRLTAP
jgi:cation-transporting ATPase E